MRASAIEQMINNGAVSRGQFGRLRQLQLRKQQQIMSIFPDTCKAETREAFEKDEKLNRPNQSQNPKKRKHKEQREQHVRP